MRVPTLDGRGRFGDPGQHLERAALPLKGKGPAGQKAPATSTQNRQIVLPDGKDAELEELMKKWRAESRTIRGRISVRTRRR